MHQVKLKALITSKSRSECISQSPYCFINLHPIGSASLQTMKMRKIWHPLWQYLNQSIFNSQSQSVWHLRRFWYLYKIQLLEKCWHKDSALVKTPEQDS